MIFLVQNWYVFSLNTDLIFLEKDFFVTKWQILKLKKKKKKKKEEDWKLGWSFFYVMHA